MRSRASRQAERAVASDSPRSPLSQENPSPTVSQSTPRRRAAFSSPDFHSPDLMNCTTAHRHPRAAARIRIPMAAVVLPLPSPVLTTTSDCARRNFSGRGSSVRGASAVMVPSSPVRSPLRCP